MSAASLAEQILGVVTAAGGPLPRKTIVERVGAQGDLLPFNVAFGSLVDAKQIITTHVDGLVLYRLPKPADLVAAAVPVAGGEEKLSPMARQRLRRGRQGDPPSEAEAPPERPAGTGKTIRARGEARALIITQLAHGPQTHRQVAEAVGDMSPENAYFQLKKLVADGLALRDDESGAYRLKPVASGESDPAPSTTVAAPAAVGASSATPNGASPSTSLSTPRQLGEVMVSTIDRLGIFSDGWLRLESGSSTLEFTPEATRTLVGFLDRTLCGARPPVGSREVA